MPILTSFTCVSDLTQVSTLQAHLHPYELYPTIPPTVKWPTAMLRLPTGRAHSTVAQLIGDEISMKMKMAPAESTGHRGRWNANFTTEGKGAMMVRDAGFNTMETTLRPD